MLETSWLASYSPPILLDVLDGQVLQTCEDESLTELEEEESDLVGVRDNQSLSSLT